MPRTRRSNLRRLSRDRTLALGLQVNLHMDPTRRRPTRATLVSFVPTAAKPSPPEPPPAPLGDFDPQRPWRLLVPTPKDPRELATWLYGRPEWSALIPEGRELELWPEHLRPERRTEFLDALHRGLELDRASLEAAVGAPSYGEVLQVILQRWSEAPSSPLLAFALRGLLVPRGAAFGATVERILERSGPQRLWVLAALANLWARPPAAPAELRWLLDQALRQVLVRLDGPTLGGEARQISQLLLTLEPALLLVFLAELQAEAETPGLLPTSRRYGEVRGSDMLHFLIEDLPAQDQERVLARLQQVLPAEAADRLRQGRGWGRLLPASTAYAELATEYWSQASLQTNAGVGATVLGLGASLWLPETVGSTILVLGTGGLSTLFSRLVWVGRVNNTVALVLGGRDLQAAWTGVDPLNGRRLRSDERLARWLSFGAGVVLFGSGARASFERGRVQADLQPAQGPYTVVAKEGAWEVQVPSRGSVAPRWPRIDERPGGAVAQLRPDSCVAACAEMLSGSSLPQAQVIERLGTPASLTWLPPLLGADWRAGYVRPRDLERLLGSGRPFGAELNAGGTLAHAVVIDGPDPQGLITVRDPDAGGWTYGMGTDELLQFWTGHTVFR